MQLGVKIWYTWKLYCCDNDGEAFSSNSWERERVLDSTRCSSCRGVYDDGFMSALLAVSFYPQRGTTQISNRRGLPLETGDFDFRGELVGKVRGISPSMEDVKGTRHKVSRAFASTATQQPEGFPWHKQGISASWVKATPSLNPSGRNEASLEERSRTRGRNARKFDHNC